MVQKHLCYYIREGKGVELGLNIYFAGRRRISFKIFSQLGAVDIYFMLFMKKITHFLFFSYMSRTKRKKVPIIGETEVPAIIFSAILLIYGETAAAASSLESSQRTLTLVVSYI